MALMTEVGTLSICGPLQRQLDKYILPKIHPRLAITKYNQSPASEIATAMVITGAALL
jgi:hypothetical protein